MCRNPYIPEPVDLNLKTLVREFFFVYVSGLMSVFSFITRALVRWRALAQNFSSHQRTNPQPSINLLWYFFAFPQIQNLGRLQKHFALGRLGL